MPKIGYARVSSTSQDLEIQKAKLKAAGCEIVRAETGSGASRDGRTELATVLEFLRAGDELVVHRLDGVVCGRGRNPTLRLWPAIFSGEIDVFPSERRNMGQEIGR